MKHITLIIHRLKKYPYKEFLYAINRVSFIIGFTISITAASATSFVFEGTDDQQEIVGVIQPVERGDISLSIKALGSVTLANEQQMRFNVLGKVTNILVEEGGTIERGTLIAELDKTDPLADVRQAELSVGEAWLRLQELQASKDQQILAAQNTVRDYERQLEEGYGELPSEQQSVDYLIEQSKRTVTEKKVLYDKSVRDLAITIEDAIGDIDGILDDIFSVLSGDKIRGSTRNQTFEVVFLFNDQNIKNKVEWRYYDATNAYKTLKGKHGSLLGVTDLRKLQLALDDAVELASSTVSLADVTYDFIQTAVPSSTYGDADLNTFKSSINSSRSEAISVLDVLRDQEATLTKPGTNTAWQDLEDTKEDLRILEMQKLNKTTAADSMERSVSKLNDTLRNEQAKLESTKTSVDVQIRQQQNTLAQRNVALEKAKRKLEDYELRAPFDGIVRRIDFQVGDNLLADAQETKYVVLENPAYLIVTVELDQVDVVHVKQGQKAFISFDALPDRQFEGEIDVIDTTPIATSGVVSYAVKIALQPTGDTILSGMTAKVDIQTASKEDVILVPSLAIQQQGQRHFVVTELGQRKPIEIGITDGMYTEVISGLEEGENIQSINVRISSGEASAQGGSAIRIPRSVGGGR